MRKSVAKRDQIKTIVEQRNRALELTRQGIKLLQEADKAYRLASLDNKLGLFSGLRHSHWYAFSEGKRLNETYQKDLIDQATKRLDQGIWERVINCTGMTDLMDRELSAELRKQLNENPPEVTVDTLLDTLEGLYVDREKTFNRSVVNIFKRLNSRGYASNSAFSIGKRMIIEYACSTFSQSLNWDAQNELSDLDRIIHIIEGKTAPGRVNDLAAIVQQALTDKKTEAESDTVKVRIFKNGNLHLMIKKPELIDKINGIIAKHYCEHALACDKRYAPAA